jgi:hypothetical protein
MLYPEDTVEDPGETRFIGEDLDPDILVSVDDAAPRVDIGVPMDP